MRRAKSTKRCFSPQLLRYLPIHLADLSATPYCKEAHELAEKRRRREQEREHVAISDSNEYDLAEKSTLREPTDVAHLVPQLPLIGRSNGRLLGGGAMRVVGHSMCLSGEMHIDSECC